MFLQEVNEEANRKEKGHIVMDEKEEKKAAVLRPAVDTVAYQRLCVTLLSVCRGVERLIPRQVLQYVLTGHVWPPSGFAPGPPFTRPSVTHSALTAAPIRQHRVLFLPPQKIQDVLPARNQKASLKAERVNGEAEERKREQHRPSPTSLLPVLLIAR